MPRNHSSGLVVFVSLVLTVSGCGADPSPTEAVGSKPAAAGNPAAPVKATGPAMPTPSVEPTSAAELTLIEAVSRSDLKTVTRTELSPDGKFLYASCWNPGSLIVFARLIDQHPFVDAAAFYTGAGACGIKTTHRSARRFPAAD